MLRGQRELWPLFRQLAETKPPVRQYYRTGYLTDGKRGYRGSLELGNEIAPQDKRAELISALFVCGNIGLTVPVVDVGIVSTAATPQLANLIFAGVIAALSVAGVAFGLGKQTEHDASAKSRRN